MVSLKTAGPQQSQKEAVQHALGLSMPPPRTVPQLVKQIQTLVSGSWSFPSAGCQHLILTCSVPRGLWAAVAKRAELGGLLPLRRTLGPAAVPLYSIVTSCSHVSNTEVQ